MAESGGGSGASGWFCGGCLSRLAAAATGRDSSREPPEITPCVAVGNGADGVEGAALTLQAVAPPLPMPDQEEVDKRFAELVVSYLMLLVGLLL